MGSPTYLGLLRTNEDFRRLWFGVVVSFFGDWFATIALYTVAQELSDDTRAVAAVLIAKTLPIFAVSPIAGTLIDRFDRRMILIGSDIARSVLTLGIIAGTLLGSLPLVIMALVLQVAFAGVFIPARTAVIPQITSPDELPVAMALSGGTWSVMLAFGAAIGGLVTAAVGVVGSLGIDSLTFLLSAAFLWGLPPLPPRREGDDGADASFLDGLRYLRGRILLPAMLLCKAGLALAIGSLVTLPLYGNGMFPATAGPVWIGALYAARGLGALIGSIGGRKVTGDQSIHLAWSIAPGYLSTALGIGMLAWAPSIGWAALCYLFAAVGNGIVWVFSGILTQRMIPRAYRGRLFSMEFGVMTLVSATSSWCAGTAMDRYGWTPRDVNLATAFVLVAPAVLWVGVLLLDRRSLAPPGKGP